MVVRTTSLAHFIFRFSCYDLKACLGHWPLISVYYSSYVILILLYIDDRIKEEDVNDCLNEEWVRLTFKWCGYYQSWERRSRESDEETKSGEEEPTQSVKHSATLQAFTSCLAWVNENNVPVHQFLILHELRDDAFCKTINKSRSEKHLGLFQVSFLVYTTVLFHIQYVTLPSD